MELVECVNDAEQTIRIEWLDIDRVVLVESTITTQHLYLEFNPINDSIHQHVYICRVTRNDEMFIEQNFTMNVAGESIHSSLAIVYCMSLYIVCHFFMWHALTNYLSLIHI